MAEHSIGPAGVPKAIQSALESLLAEFARTRTRQLDHAESFAFTEWCRSEAEERHLLEPSSNALELMSLEALSATDSDVLDADEVMTPTGITDKDRAAWMAARFEGMFDSDDPQYTPADLILCKIGSATPAYLGYCVTGDYWHAPASIEWKGFFESPDAFRRWWRGREFFAQLEEFLELPVDEKLKYWTR